MYTVHLIINFAATFYHKMDVQSMAFFWWLETQEENLCPSSQLKQFTSYPPH